MDFIRVGIPKLAIFVLFLALNPKIECQWLLPPSPPIQPPPLCMSQFALANHACALLPFNPVPPPSPPPPPPALESPAPDSPPSPPGRRHRHRHRHHDQVYRETPVEQECCRWLQEIDSECVCDLLVRLPVFLAKPMHKYTVMVDASCNVTYTCPGRLISE